MSDMGLSEFTPARKQKAGVAIAIAGASGSGKTKTALEIAVGLAGPEGSIAVMDTEGKRALHYARQYTFDHCDFKPPYTPERCTAQIQLAQRKPYDVVIFDSASDEYEGEGGLLEMSAAEGAWVKCKSRHKHSLIRHIRSSSGFVIFCLRAEEKVKFDKDSRGKLLITPQGWMPICEKRFMYDMTVSFTLSPETPGMIRFDLPRKIGDDFLPLFKEGVFIDRKVGEGLRAWAVDGDLPEEEPKAKSKAEQAVDGLIDLIQKATTGEEINAALGEEKAAAQIVWLMQRRPEEHARLYRAVNAHRTKVDGDMPEGPL
jgi:hypothetical protein